MKEYKLGQIVTIKGTKCRVVKALKKNVTRCTECIFKHFSPQCEHYLCGHLERSDHNDIVFLPLPSDKTLNKKNSVLDEGKRSEFPLPPENMRVWIRGNKERGEEVIKALTDLGAKNINKRSGECEDAIYSVDKHNKIACLSTDSDIASLVVNFYKEIKLPYKPKDKELVCCWDDDYPFSRYLVFYDAKNNRVFRSGDGSRLGAKFSHYAPYEGEWPEWAKEAVKKLED